MRAYIAIFLISWLAGIALAVNTADIKIKIAAFGAAAVLLILNNVKYQHIAASNFLILAGLIWGNHFQTVNQIPDYCLSSRHQSGVITGMLRLDGQRAQYEVKTGDGCKVLITVPPWPVYSIGNAIELTGKSQAVADIRDEYAGYAKYLTRRGIAATMFYPDVIMADDSKGSWQSTVALKLRNQAGKIFKEPVNGLVLTMTLAQRGSLSDDITGQFRRSGTSHVLAISGMHMSLFAGMLMGLVLLFPLSPLLRSLIVIVFLWFYVFLIGFPVSALRAVWFWTIFLLALRLGWLVSLPTVILLTAVVLVTNNPLILHEASFQLSVGAVIGIALSLFLVKGLPRRHIANASLGLRDLLLISLGAALATAPVIMYHFGQISLVSVLGNMAVVPLLPVFLLLAIAALAISFIVPAMALMISFIVHLIWQWWNFTTGIISSLPGAYFEELNISLWIVTAYYFILGLAADYVIKKQGRIWREIWQ